jgi:CBS domain-containing protein
MRARDIAEPYPLVTIDAPAIDAARLFAGRRLPGLIVLDRSGRPDAILPGSQVLRFMIPSYIQEDPSLAHVLDERHADRLCDALRGKTVEQLLPARRDKLPVVDADATAVEIAAVMARWRSPVVAVVDQRELLGAITVSRLLDLLIAVSSASRAQGDDPLEPPTSSAEGDDPLLEPPADEPPA